MSNYTEQAIKKSIEGGYIKNADILESGNLVTHCPNEVIFLDLDFWQALGRALGWEEKCNFDAEYRGNYILMKSWKFVWHRYVDNLANEKSTEEFFERCLKQ